MRILCKKIGLQVNDMDGDKEQYSSSGFIVCFHHKEMTNLISALMIIGRQFDYILDNPTDQEELSDWVIDQWVSRVSQQIPPNDSQKLKEVWDPFLKKA